MGTCELCNKRISDKHYYSDNRCNETGLGVVLHHDCAMQLEDLTLEDFVATLKHSPYHFKPIRRLHGTFTDPALAEDMHCRLMAQGRNPITYKRKVRAEHMVTYMLVVVADWANCCDEPQILRGRCTNCSAWLSDK